MDPLLQKELGGLPVKAIIGGQEYQLAFPIKAVILYKQKIGDNLFQVDTWKKVNPHEDPERFLACLWAALQTHHAGLAIEKLEQLVDFGNVVALMKSLTEALTSYMPKPPSEEKDPNASAPDQAPADAPEPEAPGFRKRPKY